MVNIESWSAFSLEQGFLFSSAIVIERDLTLDYGASHTSTPKGPIGDLAYKEIRMQNRSKFGAFTKQVVYTLISTDSEPPYS